MSDVKRKGRKWSPEQKEVQAAKMRRHWELHDHPRAGAEHKPETKEKLRRAYFERNVKGFCLRCGLALVKEEHAAIGLGPTCLANSLEDGSAVILEGKLVWVGDDLS